MGAILHSCTARVELGDIFIECHVLYILFAYAASEITKRFSCPVPRVPKATPAIRLHINTKTHQPLQVSNPSLTQSHFSVIAGGSPHTHQAQTQAFTGQPVYFPMENV